MKFMCPLLIVSDLERSKRFYAEVLDQVMIANFGGYIAFSGDFALRTKDSWPHPGEKEGAGGHYRGNLCALHFEENGFDDFVARLKKRRDINYLHDVITEPTGRRVIRFYDPDGHLMDVGESIAAVAKRLIDSGLTFAQVVERTGYPEEFILSSLKVLP